MGKHSTDFYSWTKEQAELLRTGRLAELDIANLIEELDDMGRSEKRELKNRLVVLLTHLLKWHYQPARRGRSWQLTIEGQRLEIQEELVDNPGLKSMLDEIFTRAYTGAQIQTAKETKLEKSTFPTICPWTVHQALDDEFWP